MHLKWNMGRNPRRSRHGFTLVEMIAVLLLVSLLSAVAGMGMVPITRGFIAARENTQAAEKVQVAMSRIVRDLHFVTDVSAGSASSITYQAPDSAGVQAWSTLSWAGSAGDPVLLDGLTLLDGVASFQLAYVRYAAGAEVSGSTWSAAARGIDITIVLDNAGATTFRSRVYPRNR